MPRLGKVLKLGIVFTVLSTLVILSVHYAKYEPTQDFEKMPLKEHLNQVAMKAGSRLSENNSQENMEGGIPLEKDKVDDDPMFYDKQYDMADKVLSEEDIAEKAKLADDAGSDLNFGLHAFYYAWYGNPIKNSEYIHWNHEYLPHWNAKISAQYPTGQKHQPPDDIGVLALSWYPPGQADDNGKPIEDYVPVIFDIAEEFNIKICFHIEPYLHRDAQSVRKDIEYIINNYGDHSAFYRHFSVKTEATMPLIYLYDSYLTKPAEWKRLFTEDGDISIRHSEYDCFAIGLLVDEKQLYDIKSSGFNGMYTYFAADGFSYGSTRTKWKDIAIFAARNNLLFIPSVGPGYDDTRVSGYDNTPTGSRTMEQTAAYDIHKAVKERARAFKANVKEAGKKSNAMIVASFDFQKTLLCPYGPWNKVNSRDRQEGAYYEFGWQTAVDCNGVEIISITSFNEWHEGTQIEPASNKPEQGSFPYLTYGAKGSDYYLELTKKWSDMWMTKWKHKEH